MGMGILSMKIKLTEDCLNELIKIGGTESFQRLNEFTKKYTDQELVSVLMTISVGKGELEIEDTNKKKTNIKDSSLWIRLEEIFYDTNEIPLVYGLTHVQNMILPIWIGLKGFDK
jgi:hypothetical protein